MDANGEARAEVDRRPAGLLSACKDAAQSLAGAGAPAPCLSGSLSCPCLLPAAQCAGVCPRRPAERPRDGGGGGVLLNGTYDLNIK